MSESLDYPDFYQPFEGRPAPEAKEQAQAADLFNEVFDDNMLRYMGTVKRHDILNLGPVAVLQQPVAAEGQTFDLTFRDQTMVENQALPQPRTSELYLRSIALKRLEHQDGKPHVHEHLVYRLGKDGVVRRINAYGIPNLAEHALKQIREHGRGNARALRVLENNLLPDSRLEEDMGLNNQPVGPEEMQGLKEFLDSAEVLSE